MIVNKTKLLAAAFIVLGSVLLVLNDLEFNPLILVLKSIGLVLFISVLAKKNN